MPKAGERDLGKERRWRQVFADWQTTGLSGAEYCRQKELTYTQFTAWNKRLRKRDAKSDGAHRRRMAARARRTEENVAGLAVSARSVEFAEVQLADRDRRTLTPAKDDVTSLLEVVLPSGIKLRLGAGCPLDLLSSVVSLLEGR